MIKEYQVTLLCENGKYRPVSTIVKHEEVDLRNIVLKREIVSAGVKKICFNKLWQKKDLLKYGYTEVKVREYDKKKIEAEAAARYEKIKEEKYASGEWKKPKKSVDNQ